MAIWFRNQLLKSRRPEAASHRALRWHEPGDNIFIMNALRRSSSDGAVADIITRSIEASFAKVHLHGFQNTSLM